jgi:Peroxin-3
MPHPPASAAAADRHRRRRRTAVAVGTTVTVAVLAAYGTYQLAKWAWQKYYGATPNDDDDDDEERRASTTTTSHYRQKRHHPSRRHQNICHDDEIVTTLEAFRTTLLSRIEQLTDVSTARLKELRKHKQQQQRNHTETTITEESNEYCSRQHEQELWMQLQVETVTRMMATVYAHTLLYVVLHVQVHWMHGHWLRQSRKAQQQQPTATTTSPTEAAVLQEQQQDHLQAAMVGLHRTFLEQGLPALVERVRHAVIPAVAAWNIHDPATALHMTAQKLGQAVTHIRRAVEHPQQSSSLLEQFFTATAAATDTHAAAAAVNTSSYMARVFLDETYDLLESPVVKDAVTDCLDTVFTMVQQHHWQPIFATNTTTTTVDRPLAHVIAQLNKRHSNTAAAAATGAVDHNNHTNTNTNIWYTVSTEPFTTAMAKLPSVREAAAISFGD